MTSAERLREQMRLLAMKGLWFEARVVEVNEQELYVVVDPSVEGMKNKRVELLPMEGPSEGMYCIPRLGSTVLVSRFEEQGYGILFYGEIDKLVALIGTARMELSADGLICTRGTARLKLTPTGVEISRGSDSLASALDDLVTAIQQITVTCAAPGIPSSPPLNLAAFATIANRLSQLLV